MLSSISLTKTFKKFMVFYFVALAIAVAMMALIYNIYMGYIMNIIKDVARNPIMIHDTFALKPALSPLVTGDIIHLRLTDSVQQEVYYHNQEKTPLLYHIKTFEVRDRGNLLFTIYAKISLNRFFLIVLALALLMLPLQIPFRKYEERELINKSNEVMAHFSKKLAHDIRTPISTLNLISTRISDENIKNLQTAVVTQINLIAEDLLNENRNLKKNKIPPSKIKSNPNLAVFYSASSDLTYGEFLKNISSEYNLKNHRHQRTINFNIDEDLKNIGMTEAQIKILYPIICNLINNSIEATNEVDGLISIHANNDRKCITVKVIDNGQGVSSEILEKLGNEIISHGKDKLSNNGLALYNARKDLKSLNGELEIKSTPGRTEATIRFPESK